MIKSVIRIYSRLISKQICPCCKAINNSGEKYCKDCGRIIEMPTDLKKFKEWEEKNVSK